MASRSNIEVTLTGKDVGLSAALRRAEGQVNAFGSSINRAVMTPLRGLVGVATSAKTALLGLAGTVGTGALAGGMLNAGREMGRLQTALNSISGGKAGQEMEYIRKVANDLGLDLNAVAASYQAIAGAAMGASLEGEKSRKIFVAVSKAAGALQLSGEQTQGALLAIGQMMSKGKVSAEELRGQLGERLPGAFQIAAKSMGMTTAEFDKAMASGKIMADDFLPKFAQALEQRFADGAAKAATGFEAGMNRVGNSLFSLQAAFGQAVTNNTFFSEALNRVAAVLDDQAKSAEENAQTWRDWAKTAGLAVLQFGEAAVNGLNAAYKGFYALKGAASAGAAALLQAYSVVLELQSGVAKSASMVALTKQARDQNKAAAEQSLADAQAAKAAAEALYGDADQNFTKMEQGSKSLEDFGGKIKKFREEMEKVEAKPINPVEGAAKEAEQELVQINGVWQNVAKNIEDTNQDTSNRFGEHWSGTFADFEKQGLAAASQVDKALDRAARPRSTTITVQQVEKRALGGLIGAARLATGGKLAGFGGGDRIPALLEAGEYVIRKEAVARFGAGLFDRLNSLRLPDLSTLAPAANPYTVNVNFALPGGGSIPMQTTPRGAQELREAEARWNRRVSHLGARR